MNQYGGEAGEGQNQVSSQSKDKQIQTAQARNPKSKKMEMFRNRDSRDTLEIPHRLTHTREAEEGQVELIKDRKRKGKPSK